MEYGAVYHNCRRAAGLVGQDRKEKKAQREQARKVEMSNYKWSWFYKDKKFRLVILVKGSYWKILSRARGWLDILFRTQTKATVVEIFWNESELEGERTDNRLLHWVRLKKTRRCKTTAMKIEKQWWICSPVGCGH